MFSSAVRIQWRVLRGAKKGVLSKFVEDAVNWSLFDLTAMQVRESFADLPADEVHNMIDDGPRERPQIQASSPKTPLPKTTEFGA